MQRTKTILGIGISQTEKVAEKAWEQLKSRDVKIDERAAAVKI